jgi:hypothetical protein
MLRRVNRLTTQEKVVLCIFLGLVLVGWGVKTWRESRLPAPAAATAPKS